MRTLARMDGRFGRAAVRLVVGAAIAALATAALAGPADAGVTTSAKKGTLDWGVKQSFREYIEGPIAQGHIDVKKPAKRTADGSFSWGKGKGSVDVDADTADVKFKGQVHFWGHEGALEVWIANPHVVLDGSDTGTLYVDARSRDIGTGEVVKYPNLAVATIDATGLDITANGKGIVKVGGLTTALTEGGVPAFAGFYGAGTELDPVSFKVKAKAKG